MDATCEVLVFGVSSKLRWDAKFIFEFPKTKSGDSIIITAFEAVLRIVPTCLGGLSQVAPAAWNGFPAQRTSWCSLEWGYSCLFDLEEECVATPVEWLFWLVDLLVWLEDLPVFTVICPVDLLFSLLSFKFNYNSGSALWQRSLLSMLYCCCSNCLLRFFLLLLCYLCYCCCI